MREGNKPVEIIPAVVPSSFKDVEEHFAKIKSVARHVQVDIVDGHYARGKTWPYRDSSTFEKVLQDEHGLPFWEGLDYEFDLMINDPVARVMDFVTAGASRVIIHALSPGATEAIQKLVELRGEGGSFSVMAGVALGAHQSPEDLEPFEAQFDFVQVMGIEREGRQGEPFDKDHKPLFLVERLHRRYPDLPLQVDGGVTAKNVRELVQAGARRLIAGSAIFKAEDPAAAYLELVALANS